MQVFCGEDSVAVALVRDERLGASARWHAQHVAAEPAEG
jgi:hypothetical protein